MIKGNKEKLADCAGVVLEQHPTSLGLGAL